jgi:hypothetical protein
MICKMQIGSNDVQKDCFANSKAMTVARGKGSN